MSKFFKNNKIVVVYDLMILVKKKELYHKLMKNFIPLSRKNGFCFAFPNLKKKTNC